jgi:hypothetical protein
VFYDYITEYIKSPFFRNEIKEFVDDNCGTFFGEDENSFQQYGLHKVRNLNNNVPYRSLNF